MCSINQDFELNVYLAIQQNEEKIFELSRFDEFLLHIFNRLINKLQPGAVKKINTMKAPFKQVRLGLKPGSFVSRSLDKIKMLLSDLVTNFVFKRSLRRSEKNLVHAQKF